MHMHWGRGHLVRRRRRIGRRRGKRRIRKGEDGGGDQVGS